MTTLPEDLQAVLLAYIGDEPVLRMNEIRLFLHEHSPLAKMPVNNVRWVPIEQVTPNDYNPNAVARIEMGLLATSIRSDGFTQPVVTFYDADRDMYIVVDGFHRYWTTRTHDDIRASTGGLLPVVVIEKNLADRMASTVRHNRARGKHSIQGMSNLVFGMLENGMTDAEVCDSLGMDPEELLRLKHITGFAKLFQNTEYRRAWKNERQILIERQYREQQQRNGHAPAQVLETDEMTTNDGNDTETEAETESRNSD